MGLLKTIVSIYLYPVGAGTEDRLRNEYIKSKQSLAKFLDNDAHVEQFAVSYKSEGYKINGFKANIQGADKRTSLSICECGTWFFKIMINSESLDTTGIRQTEQKIMDLYKPTKLVKISHLNPKADINFEKLHLLIL